jgi:hypothetical protein
MSWLGGRIRRIIYEEVRAAVNRRFQKSFADRCRRKGFRKKGCIAMNITMVKHELVKQIQKAGRLYKEGMTFIKNRPKQKDIDDSDKRQKKGMYYFKQLDNDHSPVKQCMENKVKYYSTLIIVITFDKSAAFH